MYGTCAKCGKMCRLSFHHIYPKCHFGRKGNAHTIGFCEMHHCCFENYLKKREGHHKDGTRVKRTKEFYAAVLREWMDENDD